MALHPDFPDSPHAILDPGSSLVPRRRNTAGDERREADAASDGRASASSSGVPQ